MIVNKWYTDDKVVESIILPLEKISLSIYGGVVTGSPFKLDIIGTKDVEDLIKF